MRLGVLFPLGGFLYLLIGGMVAQRKAGRPTLIIADRTPRMIRWFGAGVVGFGVVMMLLVPEAPGLEFAVMGLACLLVRRILDFTERGILNWTSFVPWQAVTEYHWIDPQTVTLKHSKGEIKLLVPPAIQSETTDHLRRHVRAPASAPSSN